MDEALIQIVKGHRVRSQEDLQVRLKKKGVAMTQSTISRALARLNIAKVNGVYTLPAIAPGASTLVDFLEVRTSGDTLLVLKTTPGNANRVAYILDNARIDGVVGSLAGDDTIFVAVETKDHRPAVVNKILALLQR